MSISLRFEAIPEGYRVFQDNHLRAVITTNQHATATDPKPDNSAKASAILAGSGTSEEKDAAIKALFSGGGKEAEINAAVRWKAMPRDSWSVHFTSPAVSVELLQAVAAQMPADSAPV